MPHVFTLGHSNHPIEKFVALLGAHGVRLVADVRSQPYSRFQPQFRREPLRAALAAAGIDYSFTGRELGARAEDPACYVDGKVDYDLLAATSEFAAGLERVATAASERPTALLCAERDPLTCHRTILVCRHLAERDIGARHILRDGNVEEGADAIARLIAEEELDDGDLFRNRAATIAEAYRRRGRKIAYSKVAVRATPSRS